MTDILHSLTSLDQFLSRWINETGSSSFFDIFFPAITDLHLTWPFKFIFVPLFLVAIIFRRKWEGVLISLGLFISLGLTDFTGSLLKHYFQRQRPFQVSEDLIQRSAAGGFSFPSNHAANMFCLVIFLTAFFPRFRWPFFIIAALVSYSRIYNGVHYPSDVLGGALLGGLMGISGAHLTKKARDYFKIRSKGISHG